MKVKCRLLYVVGQLRSGGAERQLFYLLKSLDRERYQPAVTVWNFHEDDPYVQQIRELNIPVYSCSSNPSRFGKFAALYRIVKELQPEIIHSYSFFTNVLAYYSARLIDAISIGSVRGDYIFEIRNSGRIVGYLNARWPKTQIYNNAKAAKNIQEERSVFRPKQICVVRNGLDLKQFSIQNNLKNFGDIILGVGSLFPVKRWDRLLTAAGKLQRKKAKFQIQIAGDGPLRPTLIEQTEQLGIAHFVNFLGYQKDVSMLICNARLLVHTSDAEGCPNVIMEAMACSRPVVAMNAGDIPDLVDDGITGYVVPQGKIEELVNKISQLLTDVDLCHRMGEAGRKKAELEFGLDRFVAQTLESYETEGWRP